MKIFSRIWSKIRARAAQIGSRIKALLHRNGGRIAYYGLVVLALCLIARAAEVRRGDADAQQLVLPVADVQLPVEDVEAGPQLALPEDLALLRGYADAPEWRADLELWEAHPAVDYGFARDEVTCLCGGVVRTVGESGIYGGFVEVDCGEVWMRYASLAPAEGLAPGVELDAGDRIGTADASMPGEAALGAHVHLELYEGGAAADFARFAAEKGTSAD